MSKPDILELLGNHAAVTMFDVDDAAQEIKNLRCEVAVLHRRVHVDRLRLATLRLTDAEREALETCIADDEAMTHHSRAVTLRGLLERLK